MTGNRTIRKNGAMARPQSRRAAEMVHQRKQLRTVLRPTAGLVLLLPFALIALLTLSFVWGRVYINQLAVEIAELQQQRQQILDRNEKLRIQIERLSSYGRISHIASTRSGLIPIRPQLLIVER